MKHFISAFLAVFCAVCIFLSCSDQRKNTPTDIKEITFKDPSKDYLLASNLEHTHGSAGNEGRMCDIRRETHNRY